MNTRPIAASGSTQSLQPSIMFLYWGRRGAMTQFAYELHVAAAELPDIRTTMSISRSNEMFEKFMMHGRSLHVVDTFDRASGAISILWRFRALRADLLNRLARDQTRAVIDLMPHVWSPFFVSSLRRAGIEYLPIVHDPTKHPGDRTGLANLLIDFAPRQAEHIITLSDYAAQRLRDAPHGRNKRIYVLRLPDLTYGEGGRARSLSPGEPIRVLMLGRIMAYKGLGLFLDTIEELRRRGVAVEFGIYGEGSLGDDGSRIAALRGTLVNRWLTDAEIAEALEQYHVVMLSHLEASQSGIAAAALGAGLPVVATPVGGLVEQVEHGTTGLIAAEVSAASLADCIAQMAASPSLHAKMIENIRSRRGQRSMRGFLEACVSLVTPQ